MPLFLQAHSERTALELSLGTPNELYEAKGPIQTQKVYATISQTEVVKRIWFYGLAPLTVPFANSWSIN